MTILNGLILIEKIRIYIERRFSGFRTKISVLSNSGESVFFPSFFFYRSRLRNLKFNRVQKRAFLFILTTMVI